MIPRPAQLYFFEPVHDLMEIEDKVRAIRDKETISTVQTYIGCQKLHRGATSELIYPVLPMHQARRKTTGCVLQCQSRPVQRTLG